MSQQSLLVIFPKDPTFYPTDTFSVMFTVALTL